MTLTPLNKDCAPAHVGILGHVGIGHVHSHSGFVHDDSVGFAVTVSLMRDTLPVNVCITHVSANPLTGWIEIRTADGGVGCACPRRGITPAQADIMQRAVGMDAMFCQSLTLHTLGRMYGQGVSEEAASFEAAAAYAVVDTFARRWPQYVDVAEDHFEGNRDISLGLRVQCGEVRLALVAVVNHSSGGLGPNENNEGSMLYAQAKAALMHKLGLCEAPSFIVESKAYVPAHSDDVRQRTLFVRANRQVDNLVMAELLRDSGTGTGLPMLHDFDAYPRANDMLGVQTRRLSAEITSLAAALAKTVDGAEKVRIMGELARLVSEEAGGVTFMSDGVHDIAGSGGMMPGSGAMLSMLTPKDEVVYWKVPMLMPEDLAAYRAVLFAALALLPARLTEARHEFALKRQARRT
ncbi:MAG: hypothetical protein RRY29_09540 [Desulfovibrionaceae bacterium]